MKRYSPMVTMEPDSDGQFIRVTAHEEALRDARDSRSVNIDAMQETIFRLTREIAELKKEHSSRDSLARVNQRHHDKTVSALAAANAEIRLLNCRLREAQCKLQDQTLKV